MTDSSITVGYKYRLLPTKKQHAALAAILESQRQLYNAALQERLEAYRKAGKNLSFYDQCKSLTECRRGLPEMEAVARMTQEDTLDRVNLAFAGFFNRLRKGQKPGFPRFRSKNSFKSFTIRNSDALPVDGNRLRFKGLPGSIRFHEHRPLPRGRLTQAIIRTDAKGWTVSFQVRLPCAADHAGPAVGIDLGVACLAALSDGTTVPNPRIAKKAAHEIRRRQRALSRCKKGSNRRLKVKRSLRRSFLHVVNIRKTYLHAASAKIVRYHGTIAVEKLQINNMVRNGSLANSIHDAAWASFKSMLVYKAEKAGGRVIEVDPKFTSQDCSGCGARVPKDLSVREHSCQSCGLVLDRDINAARNILHKAKWGLEVGNVAQWSERRPGNIEGSNAAFKTIF